MTENEFLLEDRIGVIRSANEKYDLEHNAYISFSGGKDSTLLSRLIDMALPGNTIPRVFIDTGIEYKAIRDFVMKLVGNDSRFHIIKPTRPIKQVLETYGYPFKSKEHSHMVAMYQHSGVGRSVKFYLGEDGNKMVLCPNVLKYQFTEEFKLKVSDQCCLRLKKMPIHKWEKANGRSIAMTGMRRDEGGQRKSIKGCIITDKDGKAIKFHPLLVVSEEWEDWLRERERVELCELYEAPFNFKRTGCKGCPFALNLQEQLSIMSIYLPAERIQCEAIWKPVYEEYRRLNYRLDTYEQMKLF